MSIRVGWIDGDRNAGTTVVGPEGQSWTPDDVGRPDILFTRTGADLTVEGWDLQLSSGSTWMVPPKDNLGSDWLGLPRMPGVSLRWLASYTSGPFQDYCIVNEIRDGRPVELRCLPMDHGHQLDHHKFDVWFTIPLDRLIAHRLGLMNNLDLIQPPDGSVGGDLDALMLIAGLVDHSWTAAAGMPHEDTIAFAGLLEALAGARLATPGV